MYLTRARYGSGTTGGVRLRVQLAMATAKVTVVEDDEGDDLTGC